jgi:hypothetical protein
MLARGASAAASGTGNNAADELFDLPTGADTAAVTADDIDGGGDMACEAATAADARRAADP